VAPSRRENCRPGKRSVDHSKRQRRPRRTDPAPIYRRRHRIPARLNRRGTGADWRRDLSPTQGRSPCDVRDWIANTEGRLRAAFFRRLRRRGVNHASHSPSVRRIRRATAVFSSLV
jgi:hypothetical protein